MNFLFPLAAWGLLTLPIILILHLLRNRRQQLPISSLRLWRGLQQKRQGRRPRNIPLSLMLMLQLLLATALTFGLAQPVFSFLLNQPQQRIFILDTTTSMTAEDASPISTRFDAARQIIQQQLEALGPQDSFALISLNNRPEILLSGEAEQKPQALLALENLAPGATGIDLTAALNLACGLVDPQRESQITVLTDGNFTLEDKPLPVVQAPLQWQLIPPLPPLEGGRERGGNQAWLNVSARTLPDGRHRLFGRVVNYSDQPATRTLRVWVGSTQTAETTIQLEPQGEVAQVWTLPASAQTAALEIVEPDPLPLDNRAELFLADTAQYRVLLVSATPETLSRALAAQPGVEVTVDPPSARSHASADFDLTVFEGSGLPLDMTAWPGGNVWVVNPPLGHPLLAGKNHGRNLRPNLSNASVLLNGVDLSGVYFGRTLQLTPPEWAQVDLTAQSSATSSSGEAVNGGPPLIFHGSSGDSRVAVWTFDLAASNLPARLALPLLTANTLQTLLAPAPQSVVAVGEPVMLNGAFSVAIPGGQRLFPPLEQQSWQGQFTRTQQPGLYQIYNAQDELVAGFAVQAGSALESNLTTRLQPETLNVERSTLNALPPQIEYYQLWPWLAGLALAVVVLEGWLAWRK
ncbi:MAG: VWA domain-containing protein [Anaerolineae bacterium]